MAVDIFKGIPDKDARYLAEKLEFKGPLLEQVSCKRSTPISLHAVFLVPTSLKTEHWAKKILTDVLTSTTEICVVSLVVTSIMACVAVGCAATVYFERHVMAWA